MTYMLPADDRAISTVTREMLSGVSAILAGLGHPGEVRLEHDSADPLPWSVWIPLDGDEELIGAGWSPDEAAEAALAQARGWTEG